MHWKRCTCKMSCGIVDWSYPSPIRNGPYSFDPFDQWIEWMCILCSVFYNNCWRVAFSTLKVHDDTKRHDWFMITFELCISRCQCQKWWHMRTYITAWQCRNSEWIWIFRWLIMDKYLYSTVNIQWSALLFFSPVNLHHVVVMIAAVYFLGSIATGLTQTVWAFKSIYSFFKECNDFSFCIYYT